MEPTRETLVKPRLSVAVYCGSRHGARPAYTEAARLLGSAIGHRGWQLVYGWPPAATWWA
jgi:predicted Rossmann-fold nucleotide-binding protein